VVAVGAVILFALAGLLWPSASGQTGGASAQPTKADRIDVVYFHRTERCESCLWTSQAASWTISTYFPTELAQGRVTYQEVDVQKRDNAVLVYRYRASGSSLYLNYVKDGKDRIVQAYDTYPYIGNLERFSERLRAKVTAGLEGPR